MAARAEDGVVDSDHRVFGVPNLYIVDGSDPAHPGLGQPGADHHGAGRPRRRPAHHAAAAAASPNSRRARHDRATARRSPASRTAVYRFPTPEPEADGTLQLGRHHRRHRHPARRRADRPGLDLQQPRRRRRHPRPPRRRRPRPRRLRHRRRLVGDAPRLPQPRHPRPGHAGHQRRRHRLVGPQGPPARRPARRPARAAAAPSVPIYGSGGFTTLTDAQLAEQVAWWQSVGCTAMKIKIGESWGTPHRPRPGPRASSCANSPAPTSQLMVDANGGYTVGQARRVGAALDDLGVAGSKNRSAATTPPGWRICAAALRCDIAAGEYAADLYDDPRPAARRRLPAARRHPLRRLHRLAARRRPRPRAQPAGLRPLRPVAARPRRRRHPQPAPRRMVRRPRPPRTAPRRWRTRRNGRRTHA